MEEQDNNRSAASGGDTTIIEVDTNGGGKGDSTTRHSAKVQRQEPKLLLELSLVGKSTIDNQNPNSRPSLLIGVRPINATLQRLRQQREQANISSATSNSLPTFKSQVYDTTPMHPSTRQQLPTTTSTSGSTMVVFDDSDCTVNSVVVSVQPPPPVSASSSIATPSPDHSFSGYANHLLFPVAPPLLRRPETATTVIADNDVSNTNTTIGNTPSVVSEETRLQNIGSFLPVDVKESDHRSISYRLDDDDSFLPVGQVNDNPSFTITTAEDDTDPEQNETASSDDVPPLSPPLLRQRRASFDSASDLVSRIRRNSRKYRPERKSDPEISALWHSSTNHEGVDYSFLERIRRQARKSIHNPKQDPPVTTTMSSRRVLVGTTAANVTTTMTTVPEYDTVEDTDTSSYQHLDLLSIPSGPTTTDNQSVAYDLDERMDQWATNYNYNASTGSSTTTTNPTGPPQYFPTDGAVVEDATDAMVVVPQPNTTFGSRQSSLRQVVKTRFLPPILVSRPTTTTNNNMIISTTHDADTHTAESTSSGMPVRTINAPTQTSILSKITGSGMEEDGDDMLSFRRKKRHHNKQCVIM